MNYIDSQYISLISSRLDKFKQKSHAFNMRCPYCGDSKKSKTKCRGWLKEDTKTRTVWFSCYNCAVHKTLKSFLYDIDYTLYSEYMRDKALEHNTPKKSLIEELKPRKPAQFYNLLGLKSIHDLPDNHPAKLYVAKRLIPVKEWVGLFYVSKFKTFCNTLIPNKFDDKYIGKDEPRLIIPFYDENKILFGFQGRSFDKKQEIKYITIMLDETKPKVYGLDRIDCNKPLRAVEGPIDAMFIDNCLSSAGGSIHTVFDKDTTIIYDNERYSKETVKKMQQAIDKGFPVVVWPDYIESNDPNSMILEGINIENIITNNTYRGLEASMKLNMWRKDV
jgi:transcription elongation factor Elf1